MDQSEHKYTHEAQALLHAFLIWITLLIIVQISYKSKIDLIRKTMICFVKGRAKHTILRTSCYLSKFGMPRSKHLGVFYLILHTWWYFDINKHFFLVCDHNACVYVQSRCPRSWDRDQTNNDIIGDKFHWHLVILYWKKGSNAFDNLQILRLFAIQRIRTFKIPVSTAWIGCVVFLQFHWDFHF